MSKTALLVLFLTASLFAENGSVSGVVVDAGTGAPLSDVAVSILENGNRTTETTTDEYGNYRLGDVPPGAYTMLVRSSDRQKETALRTIRVADGQDLSSVDFRLPTWATITGIVVDQSDVPVAGAPVYLLKAEYAQGEIQYFRQGAARTNDVGRYELSLASAGRPYIVVADIARTFSEAISNAPDDPRLRKPAYVPTFFPNSPEAQGAMALTLRSGERREGIDIPVLRATSYCVSGLVESPAGPADANLFLMGSEFNWGLSAIGGVAGLPPYGQTGPDGRFRLCGLAPGAYSLMATLPAGELNHPIALGETALDIFDEDVTGLRVTAMPGMTVSGSIEWDGEPLDAPSPGMVLARARNRAFGGSIRAQARGPGAFALEGLFVDEYVLTIRGDSSDVYVKDATYGGSSVLHAPLRVGSAIGDAQVRITLAHDGGTVDARVTDEDGDPVANASVVLIPETVRTEAGLAERMITASTDQQGTADFRNVPPGEYLALATTSGVEPAVDLIHGLWLARSRAESFDLAPNGVALVILSVP